MPASPTGDFAWGAKLTPPRVVYLGSDLSKEALFKLWARVCDEFWRTSAWGNLVYARGCSGRREAALDRHAQKKRFLWTAPYGPHSRQLCNSAYGRPAREVCPVIQGSCQCCYEGCPESLSPEFVTSCMSALSRVYPEVFAIWSLPFSGENKRTIGQPKINELRIY